ncbi:MAG: histidine triad nucleotide-binding protein [Elusimicrobia bacterium]|nr:histidine triad nucleotide-binding protein [Elusimicrobiota bacterium]
MPSNERDCLFCKVLRGDIPSKPVYHDDHVVAIRDINPQAPTHLLIISKKHIAALSAAEAEDVGLLGQIQWAAREIAARLGLDGFRLVLNNGKIAGQSVDHVHYHLLSGRRFIWPPG